MSIVYSDYLLSQLRKRYLFLFDLDLTLVQTDWSYILFVLRQVIKNCGGRCFPESAQLADFWTGNNMPRDDYIKRVLKLRPADFWREYHQLDLPESRIPKTRVIDGVLASLSRLQAQEKFIGVVTAAYPELARAEVALLNLDFDSVLSVSLHPELRPKPEPDGLLWSMKQFGCSREETVYIGDSLEDYNCANAAHVDFIHYQHNERFLQFIWKQPLLIFDDWDNSPFLQM